MRLPHFINVIRAARHEAKKHEDRSPKWPAVQKAFLATNNRCAACGGFDKLQVHHIKPFHLHPELELVPSNLVVLCMGQNDCHLYIGHGDNFRCYNPYVVEDAAYFFRNDHPDTRRALIASAKARRLK